MRFHILTLFINLKTRISFQLSEIILTSMACPVIYWTFSLSLLLLAQTSYRFWSLPPTNVMCILIPFLTIVSVKIRLYCITLQTSPLLKKYQPLPKKPIHLPPPLDKAFPITFETFSFLISL